MKLNITLLFVLIIIQSCNLKTSTTDMTHSNDKNFSCDIQTGACVPSKASEIEEVKINSTNKIKLIYFTDPICSACWAIEPELKKLKLEYGEYVDVEYKMGGLLPGWDGFSDRANGIAKPADVAHHWDEVGQHTGMSIDGDIWLEDPLDSSYPPSIAFKAVQKQGEKLALQFLRRIREMVFLEKKNITEEHFLLKAVEECNGDTVQFLVDYHDESTRQSFIKEIQEGKNYGVRGFPTFLFVGKDGKGFKISGMSGYSNYVLALEKALGAKIKPQAISYNEFDLLQKYQFLSTKEIAFVLSQDENNTLLNLKRLVDLGSVTKVPQKYGDFWRFVGAEG